MAEFNLDLSPGDIINVGGENPSGCLGVLFLGLVILTTICGEKNENPNLKLEEAVQSPEFSPNGSIGNQKVVETAKPQQSYPSYGTLDTRKDYLIIPYSSETPGLKERLRSLKEQERVLNQKHPKFEEPEPLKQSTPKYSPPTNDSLESVSDEEIQRLQSELQELQSELQVLKRYEGTISKRNTNPNKYKSRKLTGQQISENMEKELERITPQYRPVPPENTQEKKEREFREYKSALWDDVKMARRIRDKRLEKIYMESYENARANFFSK